MAVQRKKKPVRVKVKCQGNEVEVMIDPATVKLSRLNQDITEWQLLGNSDVEHIDVEPKKVGKGWPYEEPNVRVPKGKEGEAKVWKGDAKKETYRYNIIADCHVEGRLVRVVVDPDMDVMD